MFNTLNVPMTVIAEAEGRKDATRGVTPYRGLYDDAEWAAYQAGYADQRRLDDASWYALKCALAAAGTADESAKDA